MAGSDVLTLAQEGLYLLVLLVSPPVGAAVFTGLAVSVLQTATQVQEQTVGFAVRGAAVVVALLVAGPWIGDQLLEFTTTVLEMSREVSR